MGELEVLRAAIRKADAELRAAVMLAWVHGWRTDPKNAFTEAESEAWNAALAPPSSTPEAEEAGG
jgi:hypothetical protein